jgi:DNA replication protein
MSPFPGFKEGKTHIISLPAQFFKELLPQIDHFGELKLVLYFFWRLNLMEGAFRYLKKADFLADQDFMKSLSEIGEPGAALLEDSLRRAVARGILLRAAVSGENGPEDYYFLNSVKGRAAIEAILQGQWRPAQEAQPSLIPDIERPNIFQLYEENIGPLTPLIAETLRDAEETYPAQWIEEAVQIAVENNKRSWRYVDAILRRMQEGGRGEGKDRRDSQKDRRRYIEGEFADYIEH